jgi:protein gp37
MTKKFPKYSPKRGAPNKPMVFVVDCGDLFHSNVSDLFIWEAIGCLGHRPDVDWAILTKRPERIREVLEYTAYINIYMGVSCENQAMADRRIPILLASWKGPKFVSVEPMLEPITLCDSNNSWLSCGRNDEDNPVDPDTDPNIDCCESYAVNGSHYKGGIDWVIAGAESGTNRRPFNLEWAKAIYEQCKAAGIPFFGKQDSDRFPGRPLHIDGRMIHEWPGNRR